MADRFGEEFQAWRCSDCDPELLSEDDDPEHPAREHDKPYMLLVPYGDPKPNHCPRCGSYLSLCEDADKLRIMNTPAERWAAKGTDR